MLEGSLVGIKQVRDVFLSFSKTILNFKSLKSINLWIFYYFLFNLSGNTFIQILHFSFLYQFG